MRPLGTRQIVAFVNYFVVRSVQMVQSFISAMEQRIIKMEKRLSRVEVELKLLELKVDIELFVVIIIVQVVTFNSFIFGELMNGATVF